MFAKKYLKIYWGALPPKLQYFELGAQPLSRVVNQSLECIKIEPGKNSLTFVRLYNKVLLKCTFVPLKSEHSAVISYTVASSELFKNLPFLVGINYVNGPFLLAKHYLRTDPKFSSKFFLAITFPAC